MKHASLLQPDFEPDWPEIQYEKRAAFEPCTVDIVRLFLQEEKLREEVQSRTDDHDPEPDFADGPAPISETPQNEEYAAVESKFMSRLVLGLRIGTLATVLFVLGVWPWTALAVVSGTFVAVILILLALGPDRITDWAEAAYNRLKDRNPERAKRLLSHAATTSAAVTKGLSVLPDRWTRGLYLPDFEPKGPVHEKLLRDPFEKLAAEVRAQE